MIFLLLYWSCYCSRRRKNEMIKPTVNVVRVVRSFVYLFARLFVHKKWANQRKQAEGKMDRNENPKSFAKVQKVWWSAANASKYRLNSIDVVLQESLVISKSYISTTTKYTNPWPILFYKVLNAPQLMPIERRQIKTKTSDHQQFKP